jgi:hypothetical protein
MDAPIALYQRIKQVCCQSWGITPPAFEAQVRDDTIALEDVIECIMYEMTKPIIGEAVYPYIFREAVSERKQDVQEIQNLCIIYKGENDPERRKILADKIKQLGDKYNGKSSRS